MGSGQARKKESSSRLDAPHPSQVVIVGRFPESKLELRSAEDLILLGERSNVVPPDHDGTGGGPPGQTKPMVPVRVAKLTEDEFAVTTVSGHVSSVYSGSAETAVAVFDVHSLVQKVEMYAERSSQIWGLECISPLPDFESGNPMIVSGDSSSSVLVWNATSGKRIAKIGDRKDETVNQQTWCIRFVREWNSELFTSGFPSSVFRYNLEKNVMIEKIQPPYYPGHTMLGLEADKSRGVLYSFWEAGKVLVWARDCSRLVKSLPCPEPAFSGYYAEDQNLIFAGLQGGKVCVFDPRKEDRKIHKFIISSSKQHRAPVNDIDRIGERCFVSVSQDLVSWTPKGKIVATLSLGRLSSYGVCSIGSPYDRIRKTAIAADPEWDDRSHFVEQMNSRWNFCHVLRMGSKCVTVPRWC